MLAAAAAVNLGVRDRKITIDLLQNIQIKLSHNLLSLKLIPTDCKL